VAAFNGTIHGEGIADLTFALLEHFPGMKWDDLVFVEDVTTGAVVSSLCLIPWSMRLGAATLQIGEMGIVGTAEPYRRRGLVRTQVRYFMQRLNMRGCHLSVIQGIPYFYRQFGYTYAMPLEGGLIVNARELPAAAPRLIFRRATAADIPLLATFYEDSTARLAYAAVRDDASWHYLLGPALATETSSVFWLMEAPDSTPIGYLRLPDNHFGDELAVSEVSALGYDAALEALHWLVAQAHARQLPGVRLNLAASSSLARLARSLGARDLGTYAWQVHIPSPAALFRALIPTLDARLAVSLFQHWSGEVEFDCYTTGVGLVIVDGRVASVEPVAMPASDLRLHPDALTQLVLGWRTLDELHTSYPDNNVPGRWRLLLETLFPRLEGFLYATI
jgi:hypothetical protein